MGRKFEIKCLIFYDFFLFFRPVVKSRKEIIVKNGVSLNGIEIKNKPGLILFIDKNNYGIFRCGAEQVSVRSPETSTRPPRLLLHRLKDWSSMGQAPKTLSTIVY